MGTKTYRNSITQRLLDTENFKSSADMAMFRYTAEQRTQMRPSTKAITLADCINNAYASSMPNKMRTAYRIAKDKERYIFGLPKSSVSTDGVSGTKEAVVTYLNGLESSPVTILYNVLNSKNLYHYAWLALVKDYLYIPSNNELKRLTVTHDSPCFLESGQLYLSQSSLDSLIIDGNTNQHGLAMSYGKTLTRERDDSRIQPDIIIGLKDELVITYSYAGGTGTKTIDLTGVIFKEQATTIKVPIDTEYVQVMYLVNNEMKQFTYTYLSGGIVEIDKAIAYQEPFGNYYPRIYTRIWNQNLIDRADTDKEKIHTQNLMKKMGLDLEGITESLSKSIKDMNDNYKFIFLHLTVSINKEKDNLITSEYLYKYFNALYDKAISIPPSQRVEPKMVNEKGSINQTIADTRYTQELSYWKSGKYVTTGKAKNNAGVALSVGEYCVKIKAYSTGSKFWNRAHAHVLIYQNSDNQYTTIEVLNLKIVNDFGGHRVEAGSDSEDLTVPLDVDIVNSMTPKEREVIINSSLQITVSTVQVVKEKWYETGIFKIVMAAISIAINLVVPGGGLTLMALLEAVAVTIVTGIAINIAISLVIKLAVSIGLSAELIALITFAAVAVGAITGKIDLSKLTSAKDLMEATNQALNAYGKAIGNQIAKIQEEMESFGKYAADEWERLKEAQKMLDTGMIPLDLEYLTAPINGLNIYLGESAKDFYTRSTTLDIYDLTYNSVEYFLEVATSVPDEVYAYEAPKPYIDNVLLIT